MAPPALAFAVLAVVLCPATVVSFVTSAGGCFVPGRAGVVISRKEHVTTSATSVRARLDMGLDGNDMMNQRERGKASSANDNAIKSGDTSRVTFLRQQGALLGMLGLSRPAGAAPLLGGGQRDVIELEQVPPRMMIGKSQSVMWSSVAPVVAALRVEARERFSKTGAQGGREVTSFYNITHDGGDVMVGLEVDNAKTSPALGDGFAASVISPPGQYLRDDHANGAGVMPWMSFMARMTKEGYALGQPVSMFEVYSGTGGKEAVSMYAAVAEANK